MTQGLNALDKTPKKAPEPVAQLEFEEGAIIFHKGDPGGDIFFIEAGMIDVYDMKDGKEFPLATMNQGEILGLLTCLNNAPRSAHARAKVPTRLKKVPHERIRESLKNVPNWLNVILKEYAIRLQNTNDQLGSRIMELEESRKREINPMFLGKQIISCFSVIAESLAIVVDGQKFVPVQEAQDKLAETLCLESFKVITIFQAFVTGGLLKVEIEPDKKRKVVPLQIAQNAKDFTAFVTKAQSHPLRKFVRASIPDKSFRLVNAMVGFARKQHPTAKDKVTLSSSDLLQRLEKATGTPFELEPLQVFAEYKLLSIDAGEQEGEHKISFTPSTLGRMLAHVKVYRSLSELKLKELENQHKQMPKEAS